MTREHAGVCRNCVYAKWLRTKSGGEILLCRLSETDATYLKYPPLPMLSCRGWSAPEDAA